MVQRTQTLDEQNARIVSTIDKIDPWRHVSTYLLNTGSNDMAVDGSGGSPQTFSYTPPTPYDFAFVRLMLFMQTATAMTVTNFGDIAALGQGIEIKAGGQLLTTWQDNIDMYVEMYDIDTLANVSGAAADTTINGRWTLTRDMEGKGILIPNGQSLEVIINDNLSGITILRMRVKGLLVVSPS